MTVLSASSVNTYHLCHLQWWFTYVLAEPVEPSEAQAVGIAVHSMAEAILRTDGVNHLDPGDHPDPAINALVSVFRRDILPTYRKPVLIEHPFLIEVNGIPFSGHIDAVDDQSDPCDPSDGSDHTFRPGCGCGSERGLILRDLKTTGSRPQPGKYRFNMVGYWLGAREDGYEPSSMQLDYIVRTRKPYYWPEPMEELTVEDIDAFAATVERAANGIARGDYAPTGLGTWACNYCPHYGKCGPAQRLNEIDHDIP